MEDSVVKKYDNLWKAHDLSLGIRVEGVGFKVQGSRFRA